ncbi:DNA (cytosine-5)-methyltransferase 1 [Roseovarius halotolerans]|uniref:Cytosine-specific methyltransferase n=1 Tax=Roseovarius halotolerans TaxID=505353 RepID=A0A1X6ZY91_9RHOB|nr:DNA cytosine methyltransferase [Roseovarius halotolerans]RKT27682.1 DNA (cytosine-5)-methyltransferase 1 [Roseovarius halotolerans]SLN65210.1 Modification methylase BspRI [Roseovarius halotolerans]
MLDRRNAFSAVSLFSGAGGMDVGFAHAGFDIVFANDIDRDACATYRLNHSGAIHHGSLLDPEVSGLLTEQNVDLVFGGPPCQGFSVAGKMDPDDERSRLIHSFFDVVDDLQPKAFVCENVKALAFLNRWAGVRAALMERGRKNHRVALVILNAADFGVPQIRERMFLVGLHRDIFDGTDEDLQAYIEECLAAQKSQPSTVAEIVRSLGRAGTETNPRTCAAKITYARSPIMRKSPYAGMMFNGAGRPLPAKKWATTLPASMGGNKTPIIDEAEIFEGMPSFVEEYHSHLMNGGEPRTGYAPERLRRLTVDECLAIQTFPVHYRLAGSRSAQYRQIGNAVPPMLAEAVANVLARGLDGGAAMKVAAK